MKLEEYTKEELMEWIRAMDGKTWGLFSDLLDRWMTGKVFDEFEAAYKKSIKLFEEFMEIANHPDQHDDEELMAAAERLHHADLDVEEKNKRLKQFTESQLADERELLEKNDNGKIIEIPAGETKE